MGRWIFTEYGEDSCAPEPRQFWGWGRPSTIPAKCSAPATPTAGANNNELIKMLITSTNTARCVGVCLIGRANAGKQLTALALTPTNRSIQDGRGYQAYHPQVIQAIRAIAMYEASARPPRRGSDRRASPGTANPWITITTTKPEEHRYGSPSYKERMAAG